MYTVYIVMSITIYIYISIRIYIYIYTYTHHIYIYTYTVYIYIYIYTLCIYIYIYVHIHIHIIYPWLGGKGYALFNFLALRTIGLRQARHLLKVVHYLEGTAAWQQSNYGNYGGPAADFFGVEMVSKMPRNCGSNWERKGESKGN